MQRISRMCESTCKTRQEMARRLLQTARSSLHLQTANTQAEAIVGERRSGSKNYPFLNNGKVNASPKKSQRSQVMTQVTRSILTSLRGPTYLCFAIIPTEFEPGMTENEISPRPAVDSHLTWPILPFHQQSSATHEANR